MPFTISHAFFALPIRHIHVQFFSVTGLVLGSMAPDLEYFLYLEPHRGIGHTWQGLLLQALPLCLLLAALFHYIVKLPLSQHLPSTYKLDARCAALLRREQLRSLKDWGILILSIIIGFVTHIVIDEFTHAGSSLAHIFPWIWQYELLGLPIYKLLQYGGSIIGLIGLAVILCFRLACEQVESDAEATASSKQKLLFWLLVVLFSVLVTLLKLMLSPSENTIGILVVAPISGAVVGLVLTSLIVQRLSH